MTITSSPLNMVSSSANKAGVVSVGVVTGAIVGSAFIPIPVVGGAVGAVAGGYLAYKGAQIVSGAGSVASGVKSVCAKGAIGLAKLVKEIIVLPFKLLNFVLLSIPKYLADKLIGYIYKSADEIYINNADMQKLCVPLKGGVSSQEHIIKALSNNSNPPISEKEVRELVSLGENIVQALNDPNKRIKSHGNEGISVATNQGDVVVRSSLQTTRAIAWYAAAKSALNAEMIEGGTNVDMGPIVVDVLASSTFVMPDPHNKIASFIAQANSGYKTTGDLMNAQGAGSNSLAAVDDGRRVLPGGARRVVVNKLNPLTVGGPNGHERIVLQLQMNADVNLTGQRSEGHEGLGWKAMQVLSGASSKLDEVLGDITPEAHLKVRPKAGRIKVQNAIDKAFKGIPSRIQLSGTADAAVNAMKELPLVTLLRLFDQSLLSRNVPNDQEIDPNVKRGALEFIGVLGDNQYQELRDAIVDAIKQDAVGNWEVEKSRAGDEMPIPAVMSKEQMANKISSDKEDLSKGLEVLRLDTRRRAEVVRDERIAAELAIKNGEKTVGQVVTSGIGDVAVQFGKDAVAIVAVAGVGAVTAAAHLGVGAAKGIIGVPIKAAAAATRAVFSRWF